MRNVLIAAVFLLTCVATPLAYAQQQPPAAPGAASAPNVPTPEDLAALSDARIAALKEGLKLTPDQQKNWAPFETTVRDLAKQRRDRIKQVVDAQIAARGQPPDPIAALRRRADALSQASADVKRFADALEPLYKSLDDGQKRRMIILVTNVMPR
jgi:zinc resistance-associated protein